MKIRLPLARPRLLLAFKDKPPGAAGKRQLRRELASAVVLDCLFGNSGRIYLELYERGLIDENFSASYTADPTYGFAIAGGETDDIGKLRRALEQELEKTLAQGISKGDFERAPTSGLTARAIWRM